MNVQDVEPIGYQGFWGSLGDLIWWFLTVFILVAYVFVLFAVVSDLIRDKDLAGGWKALWFFGLIFFPIVTALVYLVARGSGMGARSAAAARAAHRDTEDYIRHVAQSPTDEIAKAKQLLDAGTITPAEFETLKARTLSPAGPSPSATRR